MNMRINKIVMTFVVACGVSGINAKQRFVDDVIRIKPNVHGVGSAPVVITRERPVQHESAVVVSAPSHDPVATPVVSVEPAVNQVVKQSAPVGVLPASDKLAVPASFLQRHGKQLLVATGVIVASYCAYKLYRWYKKNKSAA